MRCLKCGAELAESDKFCFSCGVSVEAAAESKQANSVQCSHCGETVDKGDKFCSFCGKELQAQRMTETEKAGVPAAMASRNPHPLMTFLGYANVFVCSVLIIVGGLGLHSIPTDFMDDDAGFFMALWATFGLMIGIGVFGGYLLSRKQPLAKRHGRRIVFLSLFMIGVFLIAFIAAFIRFE